jgi:hypothetical protein
MNAYKKPVTLRPTEHDATVLDLIAKDHQCFAGSPGDLLRIALNFYFNRRQTDDIRQDVKAIRNLLEGSDVQPV